MYNITQLSEKLQLNTIQIRAYLTLNRRKFKPYIIKRNGVTYVLEEGLQKLIEFKGDIKSIIVDEKLTDDESAQLNHMCVDEKNNQTSINEPMIHTEQIEKLKHEIDLIERTIVVIEDKITRECNEIKRLTYDLKRREAIYLRHVVKPLDASGGQGV